MIHSLNHKRVTATLNAMLLNVIQIETQESNPHLSCNAIEKIKRPTSKGVNATLTAELPKPFATRGQP